MSQSLLLSTADLARHSDGGHLPKSSTITYGLSNTATLRRPLESAQYASHDYRDALDQAGITCSMSRRGDCWDNAVVESFFGTLKMELLYELPLQTRGATRSAVAEYIDDFYNVRRRHSSLDYQSPVEFELKNGGMLGGSAPEPPFMNEGRGEQEGPGLTV